MLISASYQSVVIILSVAGTHRRFNSSRHKFMYSLLRDLIEIGYSFHRSNAASIFRLFIAYCRDLTCNGTNFELNLYGLHTKVARCIQTTRYRHDIVSTTV